MKIDNGKTEMLVDRDGIKDSDGFKLTKNFNGVKDDQHDCEEKNVENMKRYSLSPLENVNFNDIVVNASYPGRQSQKIKSKVIRLSFKRTSVDGDETTEICKYTMNGPALATFSMMFFKPSSKSKKKYHSCFCPCSHHIFLRVYVQTS